MFVLNQVLPSMFVSKRNVEAVLSSDDEQIIDNLVADINSGVVTWRDAIKVLAPIKKKYDRKSSTGETLSANPLPLKLIQAIYFVSISDTSINQSDILVEFTKYDTQLSKKLFTNYPTRQDCYDVVNYHQPKMHINYQGQKNGNLAEAIKNLVFQAGRYDTFVDIFGGSGAATLAVPRRTSAEYVYNDLDLGLACLYKVLADKKLSKLLIEYIEELKLDLQDIRVDGKTTAIFHIVDDYDIDFIEEVHKFDDSLRKRKERSLIVAWGDSEFEFHRDGEHSDNIYDYMKYFLGELNKRRGTSTEVDAFIDEYFTDLPDSIENADISKYVMEFYYHYKEITEFARNNQILQKEFYRKYPNGTVNNATWIYDQASEQYRYFEWYSYFSNLIDAENNAELEVIYNDVPGKIVVVALAEIFVWSFLTHGDKGPSAIYRMLRPVGSGDESDDYLKFVNTDFATLIRNINNLICDGRTIVENLDCLSVIKKYSNADTLYYSDYPYQGTKGYSVGGWSGENSRSLIDALIATGKRFIFSCRACARKEDVDADASKINRQTYDDVLDYFKSKGVDLWVTYIDINDKPASLADAIAQNKTTEIMITNYKVELFGDPAIFTIMSYDDFMDIVDKHLRK